MRDLEVAWHQTRWLPLEDKLLPALLASITASAMVSYHALITADHAHVNDVHVIIA
jgi:hypothetical protein